MAASTSTSPLHLDEQERNSGERWLLLLAAVFLFVGFLALDLQRQSGLYHWVHFAVWIVCSIGGVYVLDQHIPRRDPFIFPIVMFLSGWGLLLIGRLAPGFAYRQAIWLIVAVIALVLSSSYAHLLIWLRTYRYTWLFGGMTLLIGTIILGTNPSGFGPELWLGIGSVFFQPSELLKLILIAFLASYLGEHYPALRTQAMLDEQQHTGLSARIFGPILLMWGLSIVILIWQQDLGTAVLFFAVFLSLLYVASGQILILISGTGLIGLAGYAAYRLFSVVQLRIDIWLNPWPEADGRAFQVVQSLMAVASGGVFGQGVNQGSPTYIPVVHSDFVFSAAAEEWGLLGVIVIIACIAILILRGLNIAASQADRPFQALLALGISTLIGVQSLLIMGGVLKIIPLTGVTLPFMSYGGSSLLISFIMAGLLLRLSSGRR